MSAVERWIRFNLVGVLGFVVQLSTLFALTRWGDVPTPAAVGIAVFAAVSHNYLWHERYTWRDRPPRNRVLRWIAFNVSNGLVSLVMNVVVTSIVITVTTTPLLVANAIAVVAASFANFLIGDRFVFAH